MHLHIGKGPDNKFPSCLRQRKRPRFQGVSSNGRSRTVDEFGFQFGSSDSDSDSGDEEEDEQQAQPTGSSQGPTPHSKSRRNQNKPGKKSRVSPGAKTVQRNNGRKQGNQSPSKDRATCPHLPNMQSVAGDIHSELKWWHLNYLHKHHVNPPAQLLVEHPLMKNMPQWGAFHSLKLNLLYACHDIGGPQPPDLRECHGPDCVINNCV